MVTMLPSLSVGAPSCCISAPITYHMLAVFDPVSVGIAALWSVLFQNVDSTIRDWSVLDQLKQ